VEAILKVENAEWACLTFEGVIWPSVDRSTRNPDRTPRGRSVLHDFLILGRLDRRGRCLAPTVHL